MIGNRVDILVCDDGFKWELWNHVLGWNGKTIWFAVHPVTGERLLGGCVFDDPDELEKIMNLPR